jgi:hypothetical protein
MPTDLPQRKKPKQPPLGKSLLHIATLSLHTARLRARRAIIWIKKAFAADRRRRASERGRLRPPFFTGTILAPGALDGWTRLLAPARARQDCPAWLPLMLGGTFCFRRPSGDAAAVFLRRSLVRVAARDLLPSMIARTDLVQGDGPNT